MENKQKHIMKETFLYYLWEHRLITRTLITNTKQPVQVINPGYRNMDSGPDFLEARIIIGEQLWAGNVEIHVRTSDWNRHGHQHDKAYNNVVLHVVYEHDTDVNEIPVLEVKGHFELELLEQYERLIASRHWIACERSLEQVSPFVKLSCLDRMAIERLEDKSNAVAKLLNANKFDWEDTLYRLLLRYFGLKVNNEAFEYLANILPFKTLLKHGDQLLQVEAMLMGCAGFLNHEFQEQYPMLLKREFNVMRAKFGLLAMPEARWKFMRMRPVNFPTVRLAQLAQMIHLNGCLFSKIKEAEDVAEAKRLFNVKASDYWDTHYRFENESEYKPKHLGEETANVLMINAVVPLIFCYGKFHKEDSYCEKALRFLEEIDAEDNNIIRQFNAIGMTTCNAMQSQALLQLYNIYCKRKRCLECRLGNVLLK